MLLHREAEAMRKDEVLRREREVFEKERAEYELELSRRRWRPWENREEEVTGGVEIEGILDDLAVPVNGESVLVPVNTPTEGGPLGWTRTRGAHRTLEGQGQVINFLS